MKVVNNGESVIMELRIISFIWSISFYRILQYYLFTQGVPKGDDALLVNVRSSAVIGQNHRQVGAPVSPLLIRHQLKPEINQA